MPNTRTTDRIRRNVDRPTAELPALRPKLQEWYDHRVAEKKAKNAAEKLKTGFKALLERAGAKDENGSLFIEVSPPVGPIVTIKNQRSVTPTVNPDEAIKILKKHDLWAEPYVQMVPQINYDAIRGAVFEKLLTRSESNRIFGTEEHYSFYALDASGKPVSG